MTNKLEMNREELILELINKGFIIANIHNSLDEKECGVVMIGWAETGRIVEEWDIRKNDHVYHRYYDGYNVKLSEYDLESLKLEK